MIRNKEALHELTDTVNKLMQKRKEEIQQGQLETPTRKNKIRGHQQDTHKIIRSYKAIARRHKNDHSNPFSYILTVYKTFIGFYVIHLGKSKGH